MKDHDTLIKTFKKLKKKFPSVVLLLAGLGTEKIKNVNNMITLGSSKDIDHIISITGWGYDEATNKQYWNIRNSWGEYWGEMGYVRVVLGDNQLGSEASCAWATPGTWTELNIPCDEDGENC